MIVGAGFAGIGAGIELKKFGIHDFAILEKEDDLGGTWRDNTYPGLAVDVPSIAYSYSFELNPNWSRLYAPGSELKAYADHCVDKYGVRDHIQFEKTVERAEYDTENNTWSLHLTGGEVVTARYLVSASGLLLLPKKPDIDGIDSFQCKLIYSARWDHDCDLTGKRVAVIGTGATAIQLIPAIVERVAQLDVYQRTAIWLMPKPDVEFSDRTKAAFRRIPGLQRLARVANSLFADLVLGIGLLHHRQFPFLFRWARRKLVESIRNQVDDPEIQEKLIPRYDFFCKRPSFSNEYFKVFNRQDVELVTDPIERITENAIVTRDGTKREIDVLICATGYSYFDRSSPPAFEVFGKDGENLGDYWDANRFQAFGGATLPGFPNFFLVLGPYATAGISYFDMINTQVRHLTRCLRAARRRNANYIEVKQSSHDHDFEMVLRRSRNTIFGHGDCTASNSYYFDKHGDAPGLRPMTYARHWLNSRTFSMRHYDFDSR